jgi:hypothetical protein
MTNVKNYTDQELLNRVMSLKSFTFIPAGLWILFVRSNEDQNNVFDDKAYIFKFNQFQFVTSCTTNKGNKGTAVMCADQWNYDSFAYGLHKGKMEALRQVKPIPYQRDFTNDLKTNPTTEIKSNIINMNIHGATYNRGSKQVATQIGGWSEGCIVFNNNTDYEKMIKMAKDYSAVSICLINEF